MPFYLNGPLFLLGLATYLRKITECQPDRGRQAVRCAHTPG